VTIPVPKPPKRPLNPPSRKMMRMNDEDEADGQGGVLFVSAM
jgi:hypothetical protein